jgi:hypothetical protein
MPVTAIFILAAIVFFRDSLVFALDGQIGIHDPSTVILCDGKFYTYGTGGMSLVSDDGWTWRRGTPLPRRGLAPDVIHLGNRYYLYIAANSGPTKADINLLANKTLDPNSPDYKWEEGGVVASSDGVEDSNAIDPGVFLDPNTGRLWLTYGSYFGYIRLVELDPKTGKRLNPDEKPRNIAINSEASIMIYHDGCPREIPEVRLSIGSNAASVWWVNGKEVIGIYGDRQTVIDDGVSKRLTLNKGPNIVRAGIVNGGGATDFCARFLDAADKPLKEFTVNLNEASSTLASAGTRKQPEASYPGSTANRSRK